MPKVHVITGAGAGLGRALALRFACEGDDVVLLGRTQAKVEAVAAEIGPRAMAVQCDVAEPDSVRAAFRAIGERHGKIDVLINNAAIYQPSLLEEASDEHITSIINSNLVGGILCARSAIPMIRPGGHIINVTSESLALPYPHLTLYQCSKAGLEQLTKSLHLELAPKGIRVTTVRAGTMVGGGKVWEIDPGVAETFFKAAMERGLDLLKRPTTQFDSVTHVFRALVDLPPDIDVVQVGFHGRRAVME